MKEKFSMITGGLRGLLFIIVGATPKTRNYGLLFLTPILVVILAAHVFIMKGAGLFDPTVVLITALPALLIWSARSKIGPLANYGASS